MRNIESIDKDYKKTFEQTKQLIEDNNKKYHAYVTVIKDAPDNLPSGKLFGVPYGAKDNICTKDILTTACSKSLSDFVPYYDAKVITLLSEQGAMMMGKNTMDELALGSTGLSSYGEVAINPNNKEFITGGSSSGSAVSVALGEVCFALGTDTGGSVRQPAAYINIVGVKPTFDSISNDGIIASANSMDTVGVLSSTVQDSATVLNVISEGKISDKISDAGIAGLKVGVPKEYFEHKCLDPRLKAQVENCIEELKQQGAKIVEISLPHFEHTLTVYSIISTAEVSSNLGRIDGLRFGYRGEGDSWEEIMVNSRSEGFGLAAKNRIISGTYFLSGEAYEKYLIPAQKMRTLIIEDYQKAFEQVDVLITPTTPSEAYPTTVPSKNDEGMFTSGANLAGLPAINVPYKDADVQIIANLDCEAVMFQAALAIEKGRS